MNLRLAAVALTSVALTTACGSTALKSGAPATADSSLAGAGDLSVPGTAPAADGLDLVTPASAVPVTPGATSVVTPSGGSGLVPGRTSGTTSATGTVARPSTSTSNPGPTVAPKAPIRLGVIGVDTTAIADQFGKESSDAFAGIKPMISYLNANGGIVGHQIKPVYTRVDSGADMQVSGQRACTALTQDNTVDMVLSLGFGSETLNSCLLQRGISLFSPGAWAADAEWAKQYPNLFQPVAMRADRYTAAAISNAVQQGTLKSGDRLGVLVENCPWGNRIYDKVIVPLAQKHGLTLEKGTVTCITNLVSDLGPVMQDLARNAFLLSSKGATHVFSLSVAEGFFSAMFSKVASTQSFFPKYIVTSTANPYVAMDPKNPVPFSADAVKNISGLGYRPALDVGPKAPATSAQAAQQALCKKMDPSWGGAAKSTDDGRYFVLDGFYGLCDTLNAIKVVLSSNGNRFGLADMANGFQVLLDKGVSAAAVGGRYGGGSFRHDGLGLAQAMKFDTATSKLIYTGSALAVS